MGPFFVTKDTCLRDTCDCPEEKELGLWHSVLMALRLQDGPSANVPQPLTLVLPPFQPSSLPSFHPAC